MEEVVLSAYVGRIVPGRWSFLGNALSDHQKALDFILCTPGRWLELSALGRVLPGDRCLENSLLGPAICMDRDQLHYDLHAAEFRGRFLEPRVPRESCLDHRPRRDPSPDGGANWLLVNTVGYKLAYQIAIEGEKIPASRCLELGLTNKVVPDSNLMEETLNWAKRLTERAPQSMRHTKKLMRESLNSTYVDTYSSEAKKQNELFGSPDNKEGIKAFLEKRAPKFNG